MKIVRGKQKSAARVVLYGTEGIGKTTLASQFPNPLFLDTEDGSKHLDCARVVCSDWITLEATMHDLVRDAQGFETVVIDSADWMERIMIEQIVRQAGKKSIEDFGFGKGYIHVQERVAKFLAIADQLISRGINVVFVAHSKVQRTSPPDQTDGYDRYELKLTKQVAPLLREWCDLLLFTNYKTKLVEGSDGRIKASGGKERVMYAERAAAWDAKNRFGLPEEMPMSIEHLAGIFGGTPRAADPAVAKIMANASKKIAEANDDAALAKCRTRVDQLLAEETLTSEQWSQLTDLIDARAPSEEAANA
jgi:GTPase SAR1 family protein